jgi:hypothetical protein
LAGNKVIIGPEQLEGALKEVVSQYVSGVTAKVKDAATEVTKAAKKKIAADSPSRSGPVRPRGRKRRINKRYKDDWKTTMSESTFGRQGVVSNNQYRLTHLLEDGHSLRQGGRTRAFPHIRKHREQAIKDYQKRCEEIIRDGR